MFEELSVRAVESKGQTYWLTDCLVAVDPPGRWARSPDRVGDGWRRT